MIENRGDKKDEVKDIVFENGDDMSDDIELEEAEAQSAHTLQKLRKELKSCQKERQEYLDGWQRAQADMLNVKKRTTLELAKEKEKATVMYIKKLLPVCDSFRMALADDAWNDAPLSWRTGIEQTHAQLMQILEAYNVVEVGVEGDTFDPHKHEAISSVSVSKKEEHHTITRILQKGYLMDETLIRPATVVVGEYSGG